MRNKSIYLLLACVCGTVAAILASQWLKAQAGGQNSGNTSEIFVTSVAIDIGEKISAEKIQLEQWPEDKVPEGASGKLAEVDGKYAKQRFYAGEVVMPVKLMDENWKTVPKHWSVVDIDASELGISNLIQPGDRVDVVGFFDKGEFIPRSGSKTVFMGVRVYSLDGDTTRRVGETRSKAARYIQLLIHKNDNDAWSYAQELADIKLNLASDEDHTLEDGSNEAAKDFVTWIEDHRRSQEEEEERLRQLEAEQKRRDQKNQVDTEPAAIAPVAEGFSMFKLVEGRMLEYWIVPGKLPVLVDQVGEPDDQPGDPTSDGLPVNISPNDDSQRLNGKNSPFFQPTTINEALQSKN